MFQSENKKRVQLDRRDVIKRLQENNDEYNLGIAQAQACLTLPQFKDYAAQFEKTAEEIIDLILEIPLVEPIEFAFQINELRSRLKSLRALGFAVNSKALLEPRKSPPKKKEPEKNA